MQVSHHCPTVATVLVGTKSDLRSDEGTLLHLARNNEAPVTAEAANALVQELGLKCFVECSARSNEQVDAAFETAFALVVQPQQQRAATSNNNKRKQCRVQ